MKTSTEYVDIDSIVNNEKNPRKISKEKFQLLKNSVEKHDTFMEAHPVYVDDKNIIFAGNQRYRACKALGWKQVPIWRYTPEIHKQSTAYTKYGQSYEEAKEEMGIKDNVSFGEFEKKILFDTWKPEKLKELGVDFTQDKGIDGEAEIEFSEYLDEENNYVVLFFDNRINWLQAQTHFDLKSVHSKRANGKPWSKGIGRVIDGAKYLKGLTENV